MTVWVVIVPRHFPMPKRAWMGQKCDVHHLNCIWSQAASRDRIHDPKQRNHRRQGYLETKTWFLDVIQFSNGGSDHVTLDIKVLRCLVTKLGALLLFVLQCANGQPKQQLLGHVSLTQAPESKIIHLAQPQGSSFQAVFSRWFKRNGGIQGFHLHFSAYWSPSHILLH